jgi:phage shock protein PspC (stress-responsive transcriptional regulator)
LEPPPAHLRIIKQVVFSEEGPIMAAFCQRCGAGLPMSARFCSNCGAVVPVAQPIPGRPLIRPRVGRQIAGVCLALAQANGWDVTTVRIIAVLALFFSSGLVGVAYLAAWIGIPEVPPPLPGPIPPGV